MAVRSNPTAQLADRLVQLLHAQRDRGPADYPLTLSRLAALAGPETDPATFLKAVKSKNFTAHALLAQKKNPDSFVALAADSATLVASDALLLALLEQVCTPEVPTIAVANLAKKVEKPLQADLLARLHQRLEAGSLPEAVASVEIKKKPHLYLKRWPPPPPPKAPEVALAEQLLAALESRRDEANGFPWTMRDLLALAADSAPKVLQKALGSKLLKPRLLSAAKAPAAPVALVEDQDRLVASPSLLRFTLDAARSDTHQAVEAGDLAKKVAKPLQTPFKQALEQRLRERSLPDGVGVLLIKKKPHWFLMSDLGPASAATPAPVPAADEAGGPPPLDFADAFEQVFGILDRRNGSLNHVSLVELRRALPVDRETFDRELNVLRRAGRYSLSAAEGRHGLTPGDQEAALNENGTLLLYVARRG